MRAWAEHAGDVCNAPLLVPDDHWGAITQTCDLVSGHDGEHAAWLTGCIPEAALCWPQNDLHNPSAATTEAPRD